jgi:hypothetical protein
MNMKTRFVFLWYFFYFYLAQNTIYFILKIYTIAYNIYYVYVFFKKIKIHKFKFLKLRKKNSKRATWSPGSILSFRIFFVYTHSSMYASSRLIDRDSINLHTLQNKEDTCCKHTLPAVLIISLGQRKDSVWHDVDITRVN